MKRTILISIITIILLQINPLFADTYQEGFELYKQKKYSEAVEKFEKSLEDGSADEDKIHLYLGIAYFAVNQDGKAFKELNIAKMSNNRERREAAYSNIGLFYQIKGDLKNAEQNYKMAIKENPKNAIHYLMIGQVYVLTDKMEQAKEYLEKSIKLSDENYVAYTNLGDIYMKENDYKKAYENYKKAIEIKEDFIPGYKNIIYLIPEEIIPREVYKEILNKYIALNPNDPQAKQKLEKLTSIIKPKKDK